MPFLTLTFHVILEDLATNINQEKERNIKIGRKRESRGSTVIISGDINSHRKLERDSIEKLFRTVGILI